MAGNSFNIAVIGAGIAGLSCARQLVDQNHSVTVFDKGRFCGGRVASSRRHNFDYGAQYFTVADQFFAQFVADLPLVQPWQGRFAVQSDAQLTSANPHKQRFVGVPFMNTFAEHLADGLNIRLEHRVSELVKEDKFTIKGFEPGGQFSASGFDIVVLNMPPAQIESLVDTTGGAIAESDQIRVVRTAKLSPCFALMIEFAQALALPFDGIKGSGLLAWAARDSSKPGRPTGERWVLHAGAEWSEAHLEDDLQAVSELMLEQLLAWNKPWSTSQADAAPEIVYSKCHRWRYAQAANPLNVSALFDRENAIAYCGDWCQGNNIEAAFVSGRNLATMILPI